MDSGRAGYTQAQAADSYYYLQHRPRSPAYPLTDSSNPHLYPDDGRVSSYRGRPRSLPPAGRRMRTCRGFGEPTPFQDEERLRTPVEEARRVVDRTFSNSNSGLAVGVLGAIVGGIVAREVSGAATHKPRTHGHHESDKAPLIATIVGASVGGLAANALEKRVEDAKVATAEREDAWERKWGRDSRGRATRKDSVFEDRFRSESRRRSRSIVYLDDRSFRAIRGRPGL